MSCLTTQAVRLQATFVLVRYCLAGVLMRRGVSCVSSLVHRVCEQYMIALSLVKCGTGLGGYRKNSFKGLEAGLKARVGEAWKESFEEFGYLR